MHRAAINLLPRLRRWSTEQRTFSEQEQYHHTRQRSQSESTPPSVPLPLHDASPSFLPDASDEPDAQSTGAQIRRESVSEVTKEAHLIPLPDSPPRCATPVSAMDPIHETLDDGATFTSVIPSSTDRADQVRPTETDATPLSEDRPAHPSIRSDEKDGIKNQIDVLRRLATDRMAVMGLRSDTQEQGKALQRLYDQSLHDLSSIAALLKQHVSGQASDQLNAISSLLSGADKARKVFHKSQERLLEAEWDMMERENELYAQYGGEQAVPDSLNGSSERLSDSSSTHLLPYPDEDQSISVLPEQEPPLLRYGVPVFEGLEMIIQSELKDALVESGIPSSTTLHNELSESIQMVLDSRLDSRPPKRDHTEVEDISLLVRSAVGQSVQTVAAPGRTLRHSNNPVTEVKLSYVGSQFSDDSKQVPPTRQNTTEEMTLPTEYSPTTAYTIAGVSRWLAYGVPWSSLTASRQRLSYHLPGGVNSLQGLMTSNHESVALGLPLSGQLNPTGNLVNDELRARRDLLLHNWLWEPNASFDYPPAMVPTASHANPQMQGRQFDGFMRTASEESPDLGEVIRVASDMPVIAHTTNTVRSNIAISRGSSRSVP